MPIWKWIILGLLCILGYPLLRQALVLFGITSDAEEDIEADKPDE